MAFEVSATAGHLAGVDYGGRILCSRYGELWATLGDEEVAETVFRRVERVWQVWCILLPQEHMLGTCPRVVAGGGYPEWH